MLTAGMKLALKIENVSNFQSDEARHEIAGILDAALAERARLQALADCRAVCRYCARETPFDRQEHVFIFPKTRFRQEFPCKAVSIRAAWKAATGEELK